MRDRGEEEVTGTDTTERIASLSNTAASFLNEETKLSEKQAQALVAREVGGFSNEEVAEHIGVSTGASASSYVTRCRTKFNEADEQIKELEKEIERWEKTKKLQSLVEEYEDDPSLNSLEDFLDKIELDLMESQKFLIRVIEDGEQKVEVINGINPGTMRDLEVLDYKRIHSVDELFDDNS